MLLCSRLVGAEQQAHGSTAKVRPGIVVSEVWALATSKKGVSTKEK